jgi:hypothetical protein
MNDSLYFTVLQTIDLLLSIEHNKRLNLVFEITKELPFKFSFEILYYYIDEKSITQKNIFLDSDKSRLIYEFRKQFSALISKKDFDFDFSAASLLKKTEKLNLSDCITAFLKYAKRKISEDDMCILYWLGITIVDFNGTNYSVNFWSETDILMPYEEIYNKLKKLWAMQYTYYFDPFSVMLFGAFMCVYEEIKNNGDIKKIEDLTQDNRFGIGELLIYEKTSSEIDNYLSTLQPKNWEPQPVIS